MNALSERILKLQGDGPKKAEFGMRGKGEVRAGDLKVDADAVALSRGSEVLDALNRRPGAVAIVSVATSMFERPDVKAVSIDGNAPSAEAVKNGKYRVYNERGVVTMGEPKGAAKKFLEFVATAEGQKILAKRSMIPVM